MLKYRIKEILKNPEVVGIGNPVTVKGWVRTKRGNSNVAFIAVNDGSIVSTCRWWRTRPNSMRS